MRPTLRKAIPEVENSFIVREDSGLKMINNWHFHTECELLYIKKSKGTWFVGDYKGQFESGDVIFLGSEVPHSYKHEDKYVDDKEAERGQALVTLFSPEIFGDSFLNLPESKEIKNLLELSKRGIKIKGGSKTEVAQMMEDIQSAQKGRKLISLLNILQIIVERGEYELLASEGYSGPTERMNNSRLDLIIRYTYYNYQKQITIEDVASMVSMSVHSFCRFFKEKTNKTYIQFLMEVRIGQACKFLIEDDMHCAEVGYICGYNSISHFNHQFKVMKNKSPLAFKKSYLNILRDRPEINFLDKELFKN
ncbi:AraC-like DNA-binding protein [Pedobacter sp. UYEF25]